MVYKMINCLSGSDLFGFPSQRTHTSIRIERFDGETFRLQQNVGQEGR